MAAATNTTAGEVILNNNVVVGDDSNSTKALTSAGLVSLLRSSNSNTVQLALRSTFITLNQEFKALAASAATNAANSATAYRNTQLIQTQVASAVELTTQQLELISEMAQQVAIDRVAVEGALATANAIISTMIGEAIANLMVSGPLKDKLDSLDAQVAAKADLASPIFTGTPTAPTAIAATNNNQLATTGFVHSITDPMTTTLNAVVASDALKAPIANPNFTGVPTGSTATAGTNTTQLATTAFVTGAISTLTTNVANIYAPKAAPTFTGAVTLGAASSSYLQFGNVLGVKAFWYSNTASLGIQTGATYLRSPGAFYLYSGGSTHSDTAGDAGAGGTVMLTASAGAFKYLTYDVWHTGNFDPTLKANLASPSLTGVPTAPTATAGTNTIQLATTAFVTGAIGSLSTVYAPINAPSFTGVVSLGATSASLLRFGSVTGTKIDLYPSLVTVGVQSGVGYFRTNGSFFVYLNGVHSDTSGDAGTGGTRLFQVSNGTFQYLGGDIWHVGNFQPGNKADVNNPNLTGVPTAPTATLGTNTTQLATTAFVQAAAANLNLSQYALLAGATFTGRVVVPSSSTTGSGFRLSIGLAPTSPVDGDMWITAAGSLYYRTNGINYQPMPVQGGTFSGNIVLAGDATTDLMPTTKRQMDALAFKMSVRVATTTTLNVTATTDTLTNNGTLTGLAIDGQSLTVGDRVLVKDQSTQSQNGIYVVTNAGSGVAAWVLTRSSDADVWADVVQAVTSVTAGTVNAGYSYIANVPLSGVIGTTAITWSNYAGLGKADLDSPVFIGLPLAPTAPLGDSSTRLATTAFVQAAVVAVTTLTTDNLIFNAGLQVNQDRTLGTEVDISDDNYAMDGVRVIISNQGTLRCSQQVALAIATTSPYRFRAVVQTADATTNANDVAVIHIPIEGVDFAAMAFGSSSAQQFIFGAYVNLPANNYAFSFHNDDYTRSYVHPFTITGGMAGTDQLISFVVPGDTAGTWALGEGSQGLVIRLTLAAGSTYRTATVDAWQTGHYVAGTSISNFMGTVSNTLEMTDLRLYRGSTLPNWVMPDFNKTMDKALTYYEPVDTLSGAGYASGSGQGWPTYCFFKKRKAKSTPYIMAQTYSMANCTISNVNLSRNQFTALAISNGAGTLSWYSSSFVIWSRL